MNNSPWRVINQAILRLPLLALAFTLGLAQACAQNMESIRVVDASAPTIQLRCGVHPTDEVNVDAALCIAKLSGLKRGIKKWGINKYTTYIDVYNTLSGGPTSLFTGNSVRIRRVGGEVVSIDPWTEIILD